jgi:hypothetical protein
MASTVSVDHHAVEPADLAQFSLGENCGLNVHFNLALGLCTAAQFEDAFARFLPPEPNIRTLKRGRGEKT